MYDNFDEKSLFFFVAIEVDGKTIMKYPSVDFDYNEYIKTDETIPPSLPIIRLIDDSNNKIQNTEKFFDHSKLKERKEFLKKKIDFLKRLNNRKPM